MVVKPSRPKKAQKQVVPAKRVKTKSDHRRTPRGSLKLLTAFRCLDPDSDQTGFARALNLSQNGALLESPDPMHEGQTFGLEFLLDNNKIVQMNGHVIRVEKSETFYHVAIEFVKPSAGTRRLLAKQVAS